MDYWRGIADIDHRCALAGAHAPTDIFTTAARVMVKGATAVLVVLLPIEIATTLLGGCLIALTLGLFALVLTIIWLPFFGLLMGTSWLWLNFWPSRPLLLVPGVVLAVVSDVFVTLAPEPERDAKYAKLSISSEWPLSWYLLKPPADYYGHMFGSEAGERSQEGRQESEQTEE